MSDSDPIPLDDNADYRHVDHLREKIMTDAIPDTENVDVVIYVKGVRTVVGKADIVDGVITSRIDSIPPHLKFNEIRDISIGFNFYPSERSYPYPNHLKTRIVPSRTLYIDEKIAADNMLDLTEYDEKVKQYINLTNYEPPEPKFPHLNRNDIPL